MSGILLDFATWIEMNVYSCLYVRLYSIEIFTHVDNSTIIIRHDEIHFQDDLDNIISDLLSCIHIINVGMWMCANLMIWWPHFGGSHRYNVWINFKQNFKWLQNAYKWMNESSERVFVFNLFNELRRETINFWMNTK